MDSTVVLLIIALLVGFYMAWNIGANDVANAMGTSVGSGALTLKKAVIVAAVLEFVGAFFLGSNVSQTIRTGIINPEAFASEPMTLVYGLVASLLAAGVWLQLASYFGWPVSTTHSIVGAIIGFGLLVGGIEAINISMFTSIASSWVISPVLGGIIAFIIFTFLRRTIFYASSPLKAAHRWVPYIVAAVFFVLVLILFFKGFRSLKLSLPLAFSVATLAAILGNITAHLVLRWKFKYHEDPEPVVMCNPLVEASLAKAHKHLERVQSNTVGEMKYHVSLLTKELTAVQDAYNQKCQKVDRNTEYKQVEKIFCYLQILSAGFMAFAHGANDVANAIGPLIGVIQILQSGTVEVQEYIPSWILFLGGIGIVLGLATWGWRVIETVGKKITELTPSRGFAAEFAAASTIVIASKLGLPISTTHTLVGAVLGVGIARGIGSLNLGIIRDIVTSWVVTVPVGALMSMLFFKIIKFIFSS